MCGSGCGGVAMTPSCTPTAAGRAARLFVGGTAAETTCIKVLVHVRPSVRPSVSAAGEEENRHANTPGLSSTPLRGEGLAESCVTVRTDGELVVALPKSLRHARTEDGHAFRFHHVAGPDATQHQIFE